MKREQLRVAVVVILVAMVAVFVIQNREMVSTNLFMWTPTMPRFVLLGASFLAGTLAGFLLGRGRNAPDPER